MSELEKLLSASVTLEAQKKYIAKLERDNERLRRALGKARLLADIRRDIHEARLRRGAEATSMFHKPQAG